MSFSELDDLHPYREVSTSSGVELELLLNHSPSETEELCRVFPSLENGFQNEHFLFTVLRQQGILFTPEIAAYTREGKELPDDQALYVDKRVGKDVVRNISEWVHKLAAKPEEGEECERKFSPSEIKYLVGMAMEELGVSEKIAKVRVTETATQENTRYDLNAILQEARAYETAISAVAHPQHLAPDDLI